jgi:hypothetical protein
MTARVARPASSPMPACPTPSSPRLVRRSGLSARRRRPCTLSGFADRVMNVSPRSLAPVAAAASQRASDRPVLVAPVTRGGPLAAAVARSPFAPRRPLLLVASGSRPWAVARRWDGAPGTRPRPPRRRRLSHRRRSPSPEPSPTVGPSPSLPSPARPAGETPPRRPLGRATRRRRDGEPEIRPDNGRPIRTHTRPGDTPKPKHARPSD